MRIHRRLLVPASAIFSFGLLLTTAAGCGASVEEGVIQGGNADLVTPEKEAEITASREAVERKDRQEAAGGGQNARRQ